MSHSRMRVLIHITHKKDADSIVQPLRSARLGNAGDSVTFKTQNSRFI